MINLIDAHSKYNQVPMTIKDKENTSYIMEEDTFYYTIIPFSLKNVGVIFQHLMNGIL